MLLDTRSKIISQEQADERLAGKALRRVAGHFDPLLVEHVRWLRECVVPGQLLVVDVTNPVNPLLGQRARAELVAALAMVDFVVLQPGETPTDAITERFIEHVLRRHNGALTE